MKGEKGNFRNSLFGGFRRQDVVAYVTALSAERNTLRDENDALRIENENLNEELDSLREVVAHLLHEKTEETQPQSEERVVEEPVVEAPLADAEQESQSFAASGEAEANAAAATAAVEAAKYALGELRRTYGTLRVDLEMEVSHLQEDSAALQERLQHTNDFVGEIGDRIDLLDTVLGCVGTEQEE